MKKLHFVLAALLLLAILLTACAENEKSLSVYCATDPGEYRPGDTVTVHVQVTNNGRTFEWYGDADSDFGMAKLVLNSTELQYTIERVVFAYIDGPGMNHKFPQGETASKAYQFVIPEDAVPGKYTLIFRAFEEQFEIVDALTILPADSAPGSVVDTDPQVLTAAKATEIENAWYTATGATLGPWCTEEENTFTDGVRYYGTYAGFQIIFRPNGDDAITNLEVEGVTFSHNTGFGLYAYQDGSFRPLQEICTVGAISSAELQELSLRHLAYETKVKRPMIPSLTPTITLDVQQGMKLAFLTQYVDSDDYTTKDLSVVYYGEYGGAHVGFINGIFMYTQALCSETVGGVTFRYNTGQKLLVYFEGELMRLGEAYDRGILTKEHLIALHSVYAPKDDSAATE